MAYTTKSKYDSLSVGTLFGGFEAGTTLGKSINGENKLIQIVYEIDSNYGTSEGLGIKINLNEDSGFKLSVCGDELSVEAAWENNYYELICGSQKIGYTTSSDVNWDEYSVGAYEHYYIRPNTIAGAGVVGYALYGSYELAMLAGAISAGVSQSQSASNPVIWPVPVPVFNMS